MSIEADLLKIFVAAKVRVGFPLSAAT